MKLVVFSVIKNGIQNGYPFIENYGSWLPYCDQIYILDGYSSDGTHQALCRLAQLSPKVIVEQAPWPSDPRAGSSIAQFTNTALQRVRELGATDIIYVQADELYERKARVWLASPEHATLDLQKIVEIQKFVIFWNDFDRVLDLSKNADSPPGQAWIPWFAIRRFSAGAKLSSVGDGLSFEIEEKNYEKLPSPFPILHYGWNFPVNILQKHVSHFRIYADKPEYRRRGRISEKLLVARNFSPARLDALDPQYLKIARPYSGTHPACVQHLLGVKAYDPYIGLQLLRDGIVW